MVNNQNGSKPLRWWQFLRRYHCAHEHLQPIYGDDIIQSGWFRLWCTNCGKFIDGPVSLAASRP